MNAQTIKNQITNLQKRLKEAEHIELVAAGKIVKKWVQNGGKTGPDFDRFRSEIFSLFGQTDSQPTAPDTEPVAPASQPAADTKPQEAEKEKPQQKDEKKSGFWRS